MHDSVIKSVDARDAKSLKYIFVDALDVDPTFKEYEEDYEHCLRAGLFETHQELNGLKKNSSEWNMDYWKKLKRDLIANFSQERLLHMVDVAKVIYADKISRMQETAKAPTAAPPPVPPATTKIIPPAASTQPPIPSVGGKAAAQAREIEEAKKKLAEENKRVEAANAQNSRLVSQGAPPKKATGTVPMTVLIAIGAVILLLLLLILSR